MLIFINNIYISTLIYIVIISILIFNLLNHENSTKNLEQIEDEYNTINREIIGLAGLGLAMALFFARVIDRKKKVLIKNCIKFLSISVIFALISFIEFRSEKKSIFIVRKIELKNSLLLTSVAFLLVSIVYVYFNF